jgi:prophage regulatory protein
MTANDSTALDRFLLASEVEALTGVRPTRRAELEQQGQFPRRIPIGPRTVAWSESEIREWQAARLALRDDAAAEVRARYDRTPQAAVHARRRRGKDLASPA